MNKILESILLIAGLFFVIIGWGNTAIFCAVLAIYVMLESKLK